MSNRYAVMYMYITGNISCCNYRTYNELWVSTQKDLQTALAEEALLTSSKPEKVKFKSHRKYMCSFGFLCSDNFASLGSGSCLQKCIETLSKVCHHIAQIGHLFRPDSAPTETSASSSTAWCHYRQAPRTEGILTFFTIIVRVSMILFSCLAWDGQLGQLGV